MKFILASSSKGRARLLEQVGIVPDLMISPDVDETPVPGELPHLLAQRLAISKAHAVAQKIEGDCVVLGADTVTALGRRVLAKALTPEDIEHSITMLSGRRHAVISGLCVLRRRAGEIEYRSKIVKSKLKFKRLEQSEIKSYVALGEGTGKSGGYDIAGYAACFASFISASYSNILGLPLYEAKNMLNYCGIKSNINKS